MDAVTTYRITAVVAAVSRACLCCGCAFGAVTMERFMPCVVSPLARTPFFFWILGAVGSPKGIPWFI